MKKADISEYFRRLGKKGGKARADKLTKQQLSDIARTAGRAPKKKRTK